MPIQPIDLQTLFTQLDKVGKDQSVQKEGAQLQASLQNVRLQRKTDAKAHTVNEAHETGEGGAEQIKDRKGSNAGGGYSRNRGGSRAPPGEEEAGPEYIRDPDLGRNIDVSG